MTLAPTTITRRPRRVVVLLGLLGLAVNLRAALVAYPPLLQTARADLGLSAAAAGLVQASAVVLMGVGSFGATRLAGRCGWERALGLSVLVVAAGGLLRWIPASAALFGGSVLVGAGIGTAGVLLAGVVKRHLADRAGTVTGAYVVAMMVGATVASAVAVPMAVTLGGWSRSLAVWAVPALVASALWWPVARRAHRAGPASAGGAGLGSGVEAGSAGAMVGAGVGPVGDVTGQRSGPEPVAAARPGRLPWRDPFARLVAAYMAMSSAQFYGWLTWLSPYYQSLGWSPARAALLQAVWAVVQIPVALGFAAAAERRRRWLFWAGLALAGGSVGAAGALWWPTPPVVGPWLWAALLAVGVGAGFPLGLSVIAWRSPDETTAGAGTGLALGIGYLTAGAAPPLMGVLLDLTGGYPLPLTLLLAAAAVQAVTVARIGNG